MCGIAGLILSKSSQDRKKELFQVSEDIAHRGPDASGYWTNNTYQIHFVHRRLSIIDLHSSSNQPLSSSDGRYTIVFNGEIYNYTELRKECTLLGSIFKTNSDTEVIIESYRHFGDACFSNFRGMWALALFDAVKKEVTLSRDHFGVKPLYYSFTNGDIYFGSEPLALARIIPQGLQVDEVTKKLFLEDAVLERGHWTFFDKIKKFPPGTFSKLRLDSVSKLEFKSFWSFSEMERYNFHSTSEWIEAFSFKFKESISLHTLGDVSFGATLSGGLDSSSIVSTLASLGLNFKTFSTSFEKIDKRIDETFFINEVCSKFKLDNIKLFGNISEFSSAIEDTLKAQGEPYLSCSVISQNLIYKLISKSGIKVILGGQGADELLGGYDYLIRLLIREKGKDSFFDYLKESFLYSLYSLKSPRISNNYFFEKFPIEDDVGDILNFINDGDYDHRSNSLNYRPSSLQGYLKFLMLEGNLPHLLKYEDRNSMAYSIESRVPFLDPELVNLALQIPNSLILRNGLSKFILRKSMNGLIPDSVRTRRTKLGFPGPDMQVFKMATGLNLDQVGGKLWREFIYKKWENQINA